MTSTEIFPIGTQVAYKASKFQIRFGTVVAIDGERRQVEFNGCRKIETGEIQNWCVTRKTRVNVIHLSHA